MKFGEKERIKKISEIDTDMSKAKVTGVVTGVVFAWSMLTAMLTANIVGYYAAKKLGREGYSVEQRENMFWQEYRRANSFEKAFALAMRPGIRVAYITE